MERQKGFTLIELVIVIVILGILAAFVVPRFIALDKEARVSSVNALAGSMRSGAVLAHSISIAQGKAAADSVTMEDKTVTMANFYPTADEGGIANALGLSSGVIDGYTLTKATGTITYARDDAPSNGANCYVKYTAAASSGAPAVDVDDSAC